MRYCFNFQRLLPEFLQEFWCFFFRNSSPNFFTNRHKDRIGSSSQGFTKNYLENSFRDSAEIPLVVFINCSWSSLRNFPWDFLRDPIRFFQLLFKDFSEGLLEITEVTTEEFKESLKEYLRNPWSIVTRNYYCFFLILEEILEFPWCEFRSNPLRWN